MENRNLENLIAQSNLNTHKSAVLNNEISEAQKQITDLKIQYHSIFSLEKLFKLSKNLPDITELNKLKDGIIPRLKEFSSYDYKTKTGLILRIQVTHGRTKFIATSNFKYKNGTTWKYEANLSSQNP